MANVTNYGQTGEYTATSVTSSTILVPAVRAAGDLVVAILHLGGAATPTLSGWTAVPGMNGVANADGTCRTWAFYKFSDGTETTPIITFSNSTSFVGNTWGFRNVNTNTPVAAFCYAENWAATGAVGTVMPGPPTQPIFAGQAFVVGTAWSGAQPGGTVTPIHIGGSSFTFNNGTQSGTSSTAYPQYYHQGGAVTSDATLGYTYFLSTNSYTWRATPFLLIVSPPEREEYIFCKGETGSVVTPAGAIKGEAYVVGGGGAGGSVSGQAPGGAGASYAASAATFNGTWTWYFSVGTGGTTNGTAGTDGWVNFSTNAVPTAGMGVKAVRGSSSTTATAPFAPTGSMGVTVKEGGAGGAAASGGGSRGGGGGGEAGSSDLSGSASSGGAGSGSTGGAGGASVTGSGDGGKGQNGGVAGGGQAGMFPGGGAGGKGSSGASASAGGDGYVRMSFSLNPPPAGSASGSANVSGVLQASADAVAGTAGQGIGSAIGLAMIQATGSASGSSTATAVGNVAKVTVGAASGVGSAAATGASLARGSGSAPGAGAATGISAAVAASTANAACTGAASGVGSAIARSIGSAAGSVAVSGVGSSNTKVNGVGSAAGTSTVSGVGRVNNPITAAGTAAGVSGVSGVGAALFKAVGSAAGQATVLGRAPKVAPTGLAPISPAGVLAYLWFDFKNGIFWVNDQFLNPEDLFSRYDQIQPGTGWVQEMETPSARIINSDVVNFLTGVNWAVRIRASVASGGSWHPTFLSVGDSGNSDFDVQLTANVSSSRPWTVWGPYIEEDWWNGSEFKQRYSSQDYVDLSYPPWAQFPAGADLKCFAFYRTDATAFFAVDGDLTDTLTSVVQTPTRPTFSPGELTDAWIGSDEARSDKDPQYTCFTLESIAAWYPPANSADTIVIAQEPITMVDPSSTGATVGTSTGVGVAAGVGAAKASAIGAAAGSSAAIGVAAGQVSMVGSVAGSATASGVSAFKSAATGTAAGLGVVVGTGASLTKAAGSAAGAATASAALAVLLKATGSAAGAATASGASRAGRLAAGSAAGAATASGVIRPGAIMTCGASGQGSALGVLRATALIVGAGPGKADAFGDLAFLGWAQPAPHVQSWAQPAADVAVWTDAPPVSGDWS